MKKHILLPLLLLCTFTIFAQEEDTPEYKNEWGLNITGFANQFLSFNGNNAPTGPYLFTYKHIEDGKAFRMGIGLFLNNSETEGSNNVAAIENKRTNVSMRFGYEKHVPIERRWLFTAGGDVFLNYDNNKSTSPSNFGNVSIDNNQWSVGFGPVLGIHFRINQRISLGTEGTLYLRYFKSESKTNFGDFIGNSSEKTDSKGFNFSMSPPLALYFSIRI